MLRRSRVSNCLCRRAALPLGKAPGVALRRLQSQIPTDENSVCPAQSHWSISPMPLVLADLFINGIEKIPELFKQGLDGREVYMPRIYGIHRNLDLKHPNPVTNQHAAKTDNNSKIVPLGIYFKVGN